MLDYGLILWQKPRIVFSLSDEFFVKGWRHELAGAELERLDPALTERLRLKAIWLNNVGIIQRTDPAFDNSRFTVSLPSSLLVELDSWIALNCPKVSRSDAISEIVGAMMSCSETAR